MRSGRIFLHAARLTFPHPLHLSKEVWTSASATDNTSMDQYSSSASDSELELDTGSVPANCSVWMSPTTSICEDPKTRHQLLTIRASLPADLLEVLYAIPDGLDPHKLLSLGLIFQ